MESKLEKLMAEGELVSCKWPGCGPLTITIQRSMLEEAMNEWLTISLESRLRTLQSVRSAIDRATRRVQSGKAKNKDMDHLAADIALFIGHELVYSDGEKWLVKNPPIDIFRGRVN